MKPRIHIETLNIHLSTGNIERVFSVPSAFEQAQGLLYPDPSRFTSEPGSGIVYDPLTGLMWAQEETEELDWEDQNEACAACRLGNFSDWRMPTRFETESILDLERHAPCLPPIFKTHGGSVWTSTQTAWTKGDAGSSRSFFSVLMYYGYVSYHNAFYRRRARPVRSASPSSQ